MKKTPPKRNRELEQVVKALQILERQQVEDSYAQKRDRLVERVLEAYEQEGRTLEREQAVRAVEEVLGPDPDAPPPPAPRRWYHNPSTVIWVIVIVVVSIPLARILSRLLGMLFRL